MFIFPNQTNQKPSFKFFNNEIFKTNEIKTCKVDEILGHAYILSLKQFIKGFPKGAEKEDIYLCESLFDHETKSFEKIKKWESSMPPAMESVEFELYKEPLTLSKLVLDQSLKKRKSEDSETTIRKKYKTKNLVQEVIYF